MKLRQLIAFTLLSACAAQLITSKLEKDSISDLLRDIKSDADKVEFWKTNHQLNFEPLGADVNKENPKDQLEDQFYSNAGMKRPGSQNIQNSIDKTRSGFYYPRPYPRTSNYYNWYRCCTVRYFCPDDIYYPIFNRRIYAASANNAKKDIKA